MNGSRESPTMQALRANRIQWPESSDHRVESEVGDSWAPIKSLTGFPTERFPDTEIPGHPSNRLPDPPPRQDAEPPSLSRILGHDDRWMSKPRALNPQKKQNLPRSHRGRSRATSGSRILGHDDRWMSKPRALNPQTKPVTPPKTTEAGAEPLQALESSVLDDRWMSKPRALNPQNKKTTPTLTTQT